MEGRDSDASHGRGGEHQRVGRRETRERDPQTGQEEAARDEPREAAPVREKAEERLEDRRGDVRGKDEPGRRRDREPALGNEERQKRRDDPLVDVVEEVRRRQQADRAASHAGNPKGSLRGGALPSTSEV